MVLFCRVGMIVLFVIVLVFVSLLFGFWITAGSSDTFYLMIGAYIIACLTAVLFFVLYMDTQPIWHPTFATESVIESITE
jgi:hypothetical protein